MVSLIMLVQSHTDANFFFLRWVTDTNFTTHYPFFEVYHISIAHYYSTCNYTLWVPVSSTGKVSDGCMRDLEFDPRLHQKLIGVLV